jgi:hypothetical protein
MGAEGRSYKGAKKHKLKKIRAVAAAIAPFYLVQMQSSRLHLQLLALGDRVRVLAQEIERCRFFWREFGLHLLRLLLRDFG